MLPGASAPTSVFRLGSTDQDFFLFSRQKLQHYAALGRHGHAVTADTGFCEPLQHDEGAPF